MRALLTRLVNLGTTEGLDPRELKHVRLLNQICLVAALMSVMAFGDPRMRSPVLLATSFSAVALYVVALALSARQLHFAARVLVGFGSLVWISLDGVLMAPDTQQHLFIAAASTGGWLLIPRRERWLAWTGAVLGLSCLVGVELYNHWRLGALDHFPYDTLDKVTLFTILQALAFYAASQTENAEEELATERAKSDQLLLNVLPRKIAERLKTQERSIAERFEEATVLFADIVNFTQLSERTGPTKLVQLLDQIFTRFDALADQHGLEKIKTIGDAYMVVGGLPEPHVDHTLRVARMALDMQGVLAQLDPVTFEGLAIRIGIHTGPVVAGVIGTRKFAYDLWGDSVNTASRMESHGLPGRIQVTEAVYVRLKDRFEFEARGAISVKGKGELTTWFLTAPRATP
jgi:class 3 adenylate cyclase